MAVKSNKFGVVIVARRGTGGREETLWQHRRKRPAAALELLHLLDLLSLHFPHLHVLDVFVVVHSHQSLFPQQECRGVVHVVGVQELVLGGDVWVDCEFDFTRRRRG